MNEFEVLITQDERKLDLYSPPFEHKQKRATTDDLSDLTVKLFSLRIFCDYFRKVETSRRLKVKRFDLTRPIYFETYWNNKEYKKLVLKYFNSTATDLLMDVSIQIGKRVYTLFDERKSKLLMENENLKDPINPLNSKREFINTEILFNAIEFNEKEIKKKSTPIIYTGMTNRQICNLSYTIVLTINKSATKIEWRYLFAE